MTENELTIAIQGAMDCEVVVFLEAMGKYTEEKHGHYSFYVGSLQGIPVVISRTEIGMVNGAASTAFLIDKYKPSVILNQGTAGGHNPKLDVFDTIIGTEILNINSFVSNHLDEGQGMSPEAWRPMQSFKRESNGELTEFTMLKSDKRLVNIAKNLAEEYTYGNVVSGRIGSADFWNREIDRINWFHQQFETQGEEMETFAAAQIAESFQVPFLSIRTISNSEVASSQIEDLETAGKYCSEFVIKIAQAIYQDRMALTTNKKIR